MIRWHTGGGRVDVLAYHPGGKLLASANYRSPWVRIWRADGTRVHQLNFGSTAWAVTFSPDGSLLAVGGRREPVTIYSTDDWIEGGRLHATYGCHALAFAPDRTKLVAATGSSLVWWAWAREASVSPSPLVPWGQAGARDVTFTPDGRRVVANGWRGLLVAGFASDRDVRFVPLPLTRHRSRVAMAGDGRRVAATRREWDVVLWSLDTPEPPVRLPGLARDQSVRGLAFTADGASVLAAGSDGLVRSWDAATGAERPAWHFGGGGLQSLAVSPDGLTAAAGTRDGHIVVWDL